MEPTPLKEIDPKVSVILNEINSVINYRGVPTKIKLPYKYEKALSWIFAKGDMSPHERIQKAAESSQVSTQTILKWLKEPKVKQYLQERIQYLNLKSNQTLEQWVNFLWDGMEGKIQGTSFQSRCADMLGKFYGVYKEKTINESYTRSEQLVFVQKGGSELEASQESRSGRILSSEIHLLNGGAQVRQDETPSLLASYGMPETEIKGLVRGPASQPGEVNRLDGASINPTP